jgi:hypothetical protein
MEEKEEIFKQALEKAREDYQYWLGCRTDADKKIAQLKQTITSLAQLCGEDAFPKRNQEDLWDMQLSDAVIEVLKATNKPLKPVEIKEGLIRTANYEPKNYVNFMATLHSILKRLVAKGKIESLVKGKQKTYQLKSPR